MFKGFIAITLISFIFVQWTLEYYEKIFKYNINFHTWIYWTEDKKQGIGIWNKINRQFNEQFNFQSFVVVLVLQKEEKRKEN